MRKTVPAIYICGGDYTHLDPRSDCPNPLHDYPLPAGYVDANEVAAARLRARWLNQRCPQCRRYGWTPSANQPPRTNPVKIPHPSALDTREC